MNLKFQDPDLERLAFDGSFIGKWSPTLVRAYRKRINQILQVPNRHVLYAIKSLRLEKLKGKLKGQHSIRINDQYRLVYRIDKQSGEETVVVLRIEDYH